MNYEEKYKQALERARDLMTKQNPPAFNKDLISLIFPELELEPKKLDADKVIAWLVANIYDFEYYVELFKKDFKL